MNIHVSDEIREKWPGYEFVGKPFLLSDKKHYMRAKSYAFNAIHFYCFEDDHFWHEQPRIVPVKA